MHKIYSFLFIAAFELSKIRWRKLWWNDLRSLHEEVWFFVGISRFLLRYLCLTIRSNRLTAMLLQFYLVTDTQKVDNCDTSEPVSVDISPLKQDDTSEKSEEGDTLKNQTKVPYIYSMHCIKISYLPLNKYWKKKIKTSINVTELDVAA